MARDFDRNKLRKIRREKNLTQEKLAELAGVSDRYIRKMEHKQTNPSSGVLSGISSALDTPIEEFMKSNAVGDDE